MKTGFCLRSSLAFLSLILSLSLLPGQTEEQSPATDDRDRKDLFLAGTRQFTFAGRRSGESYFSPDGRRMVFQSERDPENPFFQIFQMDLETGDATRISPGTGKTTCAWIHPTENKVLFASTHDDPDALRKQKDELELRASGKARRYSWDYDPEYEIYESDLDGGSYRNLTNARGYDAEGSWSPDGRSIVFSSNRHAFENELPPKERDLFQVDPSSQVDIYIMDADGSNVRRLTRSPGYDGGPFFSPDGRKITWRRFSEDGATAEVYTMDPSGSNQKRLTHLEAMSWAPFFHPSGDYLIFTTNRHGFENFELYLVDSEGRSEPVRVTYTDGFDGLPVFSPDGSLLAWTSNRGTDKTSQIFLAQWNDSEARRALGLSRESLGPAAAAAARGGPELDRTDPAILPRDIRLYVEYLASDELEGRFTGSRGEKLATDYVAAFFESLGLSPAGDDGSYFQEFEFTAGVSLGDENRLSIVRDGQAEDLKLNEDWRPLVFSNTGEIPPSDVVFAGYGIVAPGTDDFLEYDSYAHLVVENNWVLVFRYLPEEVSAEQRQHLSRFSSLRYKSMAARDRGARGIVFVSGPTSQVKEQLVELKFDASLAGTSVAVVSATDETAARLLSSAGRDLETLQKELDTGDPVLGFPLPGVKLGAEIDVLQEKRMGRNVIARLYAGDRPAEQAVAVGAHVDHLGFGEGTTSLARPEEKGKVHYGADDNASGTAGVLEAAQYLADLKARGRLDARRDVLFGVWSGEELGIIGSNHFVDQMMKADGTVPGHGAASLSPAIVAYLNMDMIGRLDNSLILQGVGSSSVWPGLIERSNAPVGLPISTQDDSYLPTDATAFYLKGVPVLSAFTGAHSEYHSPRDTPETLNYEGAAKVARFMALAARQLAMEPEPPDYVAQAKPESSAGRSGIRVYLGTIPDYAPGDVPGVKLSGVASGGPADKAGLRAGDIIVEVAGKRIENIYDYTYALDALKIGEPADIAVRRNGERVQLSIVPGSRE